MLIGNEIQDGKTCKNFNLFGIFICSLKFKISHCTLSQYSRSMKGRRRRSLNVLEQKSNVVGKTGIVVEKKTSSEGQEC